MLRRQESYLQEMFYLEFIKGFWNPRQIGQERLGTKPKMALPFPLRNPRWRMWNVHNTGFDIHENKSPQHPHPVYYMVVFESITQDLIFMNPLPPVYCMVVFEMPRWASHPRTSIIYLGISQMLPDPFTTEILLSLRDCFLKVTFTKKTIFCDKVAINV